MKSRIFSCVPAAALLASAQPLLAKQSGNTCAQAVSENRRKQSRPIADCAALGPAGIEPLFQTYAREIDNKVANPLLAETRMETVSAALDAVSQQKDSYFPGSYWYTDFRRGQKQGARRAQNQFSRCACWRKVERGFSCANSRFFRTFLYSNAAVQKCCAKIYLYCSQNALRRV